MDAINKTIENIYTQNTHILTHLSNDKSNNELTEDEKREVEQLKKRDIEVRAHEEAHKSAAGNLAKGAPHYKFELGPDGKRYAVSGSIQIETSEGSTPDETILKAERIKKAALAPVHPSSQDRKIAAQAQKMASEARAEKLSKTESNEKEEVKNKKILNDYQNHSSNTQVNSSINAKI